LERGEIETARAYLTESLAKYRSAGIKSGVAHVLSLLGDLARQEGDYAAAHTIYAESMTLRQEVKLSTGFVDALESHATLALCESQWERSLTLWAAAEALRETIHWPMPPRKQETTRARIEAARAAIDPKARPLLWETGRAMTLEQAIAFMLETP